MTCVQLYKLHILFHLKQSAHTIHYNNYNDYEICQNPWSVVDILY